MESNHGNQVTVLLGKARGHTTAETHQLGQQCTQCDHTMGHNMINTTPQHTRYTCAVQCWQIRPQTLQLAKAEVDL